MLGLGLSLTSAALMGGAAWSPAALFDGGLPGHWPGGYDPAGEGMLQSYPSNSLTTAAGQPVSLVMDMSKGRDLSPELLTNTDFSGGAAGWMLGTGMEVVAGQLTMTASSSGQLAQQIIASSADRLFLIDWTLNSVSAGAIASIFGGTTVGFYGPSRAVPGRYLEYGIGLGTPDRFGLRAAGTATGVVSSVSCKEVFGFHAKQPTSLSRPTLAQSGGKWYLTSDGGDSLPVSLPAGTYGRAWVNADGTVTVDTVTDPTNALIPTAVNSTQADVILRQGAFTAEEEASIRSYWAERYAA